MKYDGQIETYRFIGDSTENKAKRLVKGEPTELYTQTEIINALNENKSLVCGGVKVRTRKNDSRLMYAIYYGKEKSNPDQIIKIVVDKENLEKGDINTLAIDSLCQHSIRVHKRNNRKIAGIVAASIVAGGIVAGSIVGVISWAFNKEESAKEKYINEYQQWLQEQQIENGTYKSSLEEQGLIDENSISQIVEETINGRSY